MQDNENNTNDSKVNSSEEEVCQFQLVFKHFLALFVPAPHAQYCCMFIMIVVRIGKNTVR